VTDSMEIGGVETNLVGLTRTLQEFGHDVCVCSSGGQLVSSLRQQNTRHVQFDICLRRPLRLFASMARMSRWMRTEKFDVIHTMSAAGNLTTLFVSSRGPQKITSPMGLQNSSAEPLFVTYLRLWLHTLGARTTLAISEAIYDMLGRLPGPRGHVIKCNVNGIDCDRFRATSADRDRIRTELGIECDATLITTIGALHPRKSHDLFVRAASIISEHILGARFLVVGDGPLHQLLVRQANELGLGEQVIFSGARQDIPAILAATDVYVKPGTVEGFTGITVLEAMAARKPVVAFDTRDVRAAIIPGRSGFLAPPNDVNGLAEIIIHLLRHPNQLNAIVDFASEFVSREFSLAAVVKRLERIYAHVDVRSAA